MSSLIIKWLFLLSALFIPLDCEIYEDRPKIKTSGGNLILEPALNKNIYLRVNGPKSRIFVGDVNILQTNTPGDGITQLPPTNANINSQLQAITQRLDKLENIEASIPNDLLFNISLLWRKVNNMQRKLINLKSQINNRGKDECQSDPCKHGGTCLNLMDGYHCLCPNNWEGTDCDVDVNECRNFAGTDLGCQNGATCINRPGSYECLCKSNWFGLHCTRKAKDCSGGNFEMCGHGTCLEVTTGEGIHCLCHQGWTTNGTGIACLTDINECESSQGPRCSMNPKVECINLPGSFRCGQCPAGYEGDGYSCSDIDECTAITNGGCSPLVTCHNTIGSRICGSCPPGYQGDGITCSWRGSCNIGHGGCHPSARCEERPSPTGQANQCICPEGMEGDGFGISGCYVSTGNIGNFTDSCENNPCGSHGQCHHLRTGYTCICLRGYSGAHCDTPADVCAVNPCRNNGICRPDVTKFNGFRCECTAQFSGALCEVRLKTCGGVLLGEEGSIVYPLTNTTYNHNSQCAWIIVTVPDKVLNVTFSKFDLEPGSGCSYDFLQIHDGRKSSSQLIGRFCGNNLPKGGNIVSSHNSLYLWFHSDKTVAKDGFALHWTSIAPVCGGEIDASVHGHISSPGSPGQYPPNRDCYWHLITSLGKRINLHFFALDIEAHNSCNFDYLAIYDGEHVTDPLIQKYCNSSQPAPVQSAGSDILIHFHSDAYGSGQGFQIAFAPIEGIPGCGGYFTADRGEIISPTYNGLYLSNLLCEYKIKTSPDTKIKLNFKSFSLERSFRCKYDYLKIYDGSSSESPIVGKFCGTTYPKTYISSSNMLYFKFKTDRSLHEEGFRITYEALCEKIIEGDSGIIKSPGYPFSYPDNKVCVYIIRTVPGKAIQLTFQDFDIEDNRYYDCRYDSVEVRDGHDSNSTLMGRYCGGAAHTPPVQTSTLNYMYIKFTSDMSLSGTGFYANYTTVDVECGGIHRETTGLINFPSDDLYKNSQSCRWLLIAPEGMHIKLSWNRFDIEQMSNCGSDYLEIIEIDDTNENNTIGKFCGTHMPPALTTSTNRLMLRFESDGSIRSTGFSLSYTFLDEKSHCGGQYFKTHGFIYSPGWPRSYEPNLDCTWIITVPVGQQIMLNISEFQLERPIRDKCNLGDYLEIRNGDKDNSPLIGQYCGSFPSKRIISLSNTLHLHFYSDFYLTGTGFKIEWDGTIIGCGGTLTSPSGSLSSPNYPNEYSENAECFYRIVTSAGSRIHIMFTDVELERTPNCRDDYIEIFDGRDTDAHSFGRHCIMSPTLTSIETTTNYAYIKFRSDIYQGGKGFMLNYQTLCNNNITGTFGVIESPGHPSNYPMSMSCLWNIQVPKGNKINVTFTAFDIYSPRFYHIFRNRVSTFGNECHHDYLQIKEPTDPNYSKKYCGSTLPTSISTKSNALQIKFSSGMYLTRTGFRLEWVSYGCGGHIQKSSGTVSLDRSKTIEKDMECEWLIETQAGKSITIAFSEIYMTDSPNCTTDAIEIYNGRSTKAPLLAKFCHRDYVSVQSDSNFMLIRFVKQSTLRDVHFMSIFYSLKAKCGGSIHSQTGLIYSKNYPKNYDNNLDCLWYLTVPAYHRIELNFIDIDLYSFSDKVELLERNCGDSIEIYDEYGLTETSNYTYRICPNSNITHIYSKHNSMIVKFVSDIFGTAKGFKANFTITCGRIIQAKLDGFIQSDNFVNHYNESCIWTILADTDKKISLTLTLLSLPKDNVVNSNRNCPSSFLRVLDGDDKNAPLIGEYCGRKVPPMIVSRGSALTIEFGSYSGKISGMFAAHYSPLSNACGGTLSSEEGTIASPNYPGPYPANIDCEWFVKTSPGNTAYVQFEKLTLDYSESCNEDYVEIRETNGAGRLLGVYCGNVIPTNHTAASEIYIKFHSDSKTSGLGFLLHYGLQHENYIQGDSGEVSSPLYPNRYIGVGEYTWRVMTADTESLSITVDKLEIYSLSGVNYNKLIIYDGYDTTAPVLEELAGVIVDTKIIQSSSSVVYIKLTMDDTNKGSIFHVTWTKTSRNQDIDTEEKVNCGNNHTQIILPGQALTFSSPNYPNDYNDDLNCEWVYQSQIGRHLSLRFVDFNIEETHACFADSVSIYSADTPGNWKLVKDNICSVESANSAVNSSTYMKIKFKTDSSITKKGFFARIASKCGGVITATSGEFGPTWSELQSDIRYSYNVRCTWTVKVRPGRTIKLDFNHFNLTSKNGDCSSYVILRNGDSIEAPLLGSGKYCGNEHEIKGDINTSSNSLFVSFTKKEFAYRTFSIIYEEKRDECGSTTALTADHNWEVISSPNYPSVPTPYSECEWIFTGPPGEILRIDFIDRFDLDNIDDCGSEVVEIRDGSSNLSPLKGRFCSDTPPTIKTSSNRMYIKYLTQLVEPRNGFKANISLDVCGGTIISNNGELTSPGYPHMPVLPYGTVCTWRIIGRPRYAFKFKVEDLQLPQSETPCATKVTVEQYMPVNNSNIVLKTLCDVFTDRDYEVIETSSNNITVKLQFGKPDTWDQMSNNRGFRFSFNTSRPICGGVITWSEGYLTTPSYPQDTTLKYCQWSITVPNKSRKVRLELLDVDPERHKIAIFNDITFHTLITSLNKTTDSTVFTSSGYQMGLYIWADRSFASHRFKAKFSSDEPALCGGELSGLSQEIVSPNVNRSYTCEWHYNNKERLVQNDDLTSNFSYNSIFLTAKINSSDSRTRCRYFVPHVVITIPLKSHFTREICGNTEVSFRIPTPVINIKAYRNYRQSLYYRLNWKLQPCGGFIEIGTNPKNILLIPDYYNDTLDCAWVISDPMGNSKIIVKMEGAFLLDCDNEYLTLQSSLRQAAPPIGKYCKGNLLDNTLVTHFDYLYIQYHANVKNNTNIKLIAWTASEKCGGLLSSYENMFTSPNYPKSYSPNEECSWEIHADAGYRVSLRFVERFVIEDKQNCTKDVVIIYDWRDGEYTEMARVCGRHLPPVYNSTYSKMKVVFRTDSDINLDGFKAEWHSICGGKYIATEKEHILYSPGYPYSYPPRMSCSYEISAPNQKVLIKFLDFELEGPSPNCLFENLTVTAQSDYNFFYREFCGDTIPQPISQFEKISLVFKSDSSIQKKGFRISYSIYKCGGKINDTTVISSSIIDNYEENMNCTWLIEGTPSKIAVVKFLYIDLESHNQCYNDYIAVYEGPRIIEDKRLALLCGHVNSTTVLRSKGSTMLLQFVSDNSINFKGFKAQVYFSYSEAAHCGGQIDLTSSSQTFKSPLMGHAVYENFLECFWSIISPVDTVIKIDFTSFHVSPCQNINQTAVGYSKCDCDLVEIRDGLNPNSLVIGTYCGHTLPPQLISSGNKMSVRLSTDGEIGSQGFEARLTVQQSLCDHSIITVTHTPQRLKSPGFEAGSIPRNLHCSYLLNDPDPYSLIRISVLSLDIQPPIIDSAQVNRCTKDKLIISSNPNHPNDTLGKDYVLNARTDEFFNRYFLYESSMRLPDHFEICGRKQSVDFYVYGKTAINLITSAESDSNSYKGLEVEIVYAGFCGRNYSEPYGRIQSTFSNNVENLKDCYTLITAPENYTISAYFISAMPDYWDEDSYLSIFDGNNTSAPRLFKIHTRVENNKPAFSTGRYMLLHNHDNNNNRVTFDLNYVTSNKGPGCGGKLLNEVGRITSPMYPVSYRHVSRCEWELETPVGTNLLLHFSVFDLGVTCDQNYVQLVDSKGVVLRTFCSETPADFTSDNNYVKVVFVTTMNNGGTGWVADFIGIMV